MTIRRLGIALALGAALTAASCSSDPAEQAESAAADAGASATEAVGDAVSEATGADSEPTSATPQELLLTPEEVTQMPMQVADPELLAQTGAGLEMPEGMELQVDPPECAGAADLSATLADDIADGGLAALMGGGSDAPAMYSVQVLRTSVGFDEYESNWSNCSEVQFSGQSVGITGSSTEVDAPDIEGADDVIARTSDTTIESLGEGGRMVNTVYLTEVRGVKVLVGAMTPPDAGGELGPEVEGQLAELMTQQVAKVNDAA